MGNVLQDMQKRLARRSAAKTTIATAFGRLCEPTLEQTFLRPLLRNMNLEEEFANEAYLHPSLLLQEQMSEMYPGVHSKLDMLMKHPDDDSSKALRLALVERAGDLNNHVLLQYVWAFVEIDERIQCFLMN